MELWSWARYDFGLSDAEFGELTPGEFQALCHRRNTGIRYERYAHALTAAAVYNVHRGKTEDPMLTAMDFVRTEEQAGRRERMLKAKRYLNRALGSLPLSTPREKFLEVRGKAIVDLKASGYEDAEQIVDETFPSLKENR